MFKRTSSDKYKLISIAVTVLCMTYLFTKQLGDGIISQILNGAAFVFLIYSLFFKIDPRVHDDEDDLAKGRDLTPLMIAAAKGNVEQINDILSEGVDVNQQSKKGYTALMYAARNGHLETVTRLINYGANKDMRSNAHKTAQDFARMSDHKDIVDALD